jgi:hypothetical protein
MPLDSWLDALDDIDSQPVDSSEFQVTAARVEDNQWVCAAPCLDEPLTVSVEAAVLSFYVWEHLCVCPIPTVLSDETVAEIVSNRLRTW